MVMMTTMMLMLMTQKRSVVTSMDFPCLFAGFNILSIFDHGCYSIHGNSSMFFFSLITAETSYQRRTRTEPLQHICG